MGDERTLKELAAPKLDDEPLGIVFSSMEKPLKKLRFFSTFYQNSMAMEVRIQIDFLKNFWLCILL
ncbi:hypothetical protein BVRB_6g144720 [Beta vulgaris subsp. vulgaris]|nr:hypothetical protein BVRB_6g144720 [Beta vulgaris subsp. vulgaris]